MRRADLERVVRARTAALESEGRALRTQAGLTQGEVGALCGVSHAAVSRWEHGNRRPRGDTAVKYGEVLERLANALEVLR